MNVLAELQKRGFQVVLCPGGAQVKITGNLAMHRLAQQTGTTLVDQLNHAIQLIVSGEMTMILLPVDRRCERCGGALINAPEVHSILCRSCGIITPEP